MDANDPPAAAATPLGSSASAPWADLRTLATVALCLVIAAAAWYLLKELAALFRPLFLAIFVGYIILPLHFFLKRRIPSLLSVLALSAVSVLLLYLMALLVYGSFVDLHRELPALTDRARQLGQEARGWSQRNAPGLANLLADSAGAEERGAAELKMAAGYLVDLGAHLLFEALEVGFYLIFLLLEIGYLPQRVRGSFSPERSGQIFDVITRINVAMAGYLKLKFIASFVLAVLVTVMLYAFGVKFAILWGVLTFFGNFIPYLGSTVAWVIPTGFAFLQPGLTWQPFVVAGLLGALHLLMHYMLEPALTGKAINLSPLVILIALTFWGLCWGLTGMLLAVPLTVMVKIILENVPFTRPVGKLMGEG